MKRKALMESISSDLHNFLKSQVNLEKIRTFRWSAICGLVLLAVLVMICLGWLVEAEPNICDWLVCLSQPLPDNPDFLLYRLLAGLNESNKRLFPASQGFAAEKLTAKSLSLGQKTFDS